MANGCKGCLPMETALLGGGVLHVLSRKLLLFKLLVDKSCRGVSLITQVGLSKHRVLSANARQSYAFEGSAAQASFSEINGTDRSPVLRGSSLNGPH